MTKTKMIAIKRTYYAGQFHEPGKAFDVDPKYVETLSKLRVARLAAEPDPDPKRYRRRDMRAES